MENAYNVAEFVSVVADDTDVGDTILEVKKNKGSDNMQDFYKVYADKKVKDAVEVKDKVIEEKDKEIEDSIISALKDGSLSDDKIKLIFKISDERLAEIKSKIND